MIALTNTKSAESSGKNCLADLLTGNTPKLPEEPTEALSKTIVRNAKDDASGQQDQHDDFASQLASFCESLTTITEETADTSDQQLAHTDADTTEHDASAELDNAPRQNRFVFLSTGTTTEPVETESLNTQTHSTPDITRPMAGEQVPGEPQPQGSPSLPHNSPANSSQMPVTTDQQSQNLTGATDNIETQAPTQQPVLNPARATSNQTTAPQSTEQTITAETQITNANTVTDEAGSSQKPLTTLQDPVLADQNTRNQNHSDDTGAEDTTDQENDSIRIAETDETEDETAPVHNNDTQRTAAFHAATTKETAENGNSSFTAGATNDRILEIEPQQPNQSTATPAQITPPSPVLPAQDTSQLVMNLQTLRDQFDVLALQAMRNDQNQIRIELEPLMLGRLIMTCRETRDGLELNINTQSEEVRQILVQQEQNLRTNLESQGLQLGQFSVATEDRQERQHNFQQLTEDTQQTLPTTTNIQKNTKPAQLQQHHATDSSSKHWIA